LRSSGSLGPTIDLALSTPKTGITATVVSDYVLAPELAARSSFGTCSELHVGLEVLCPSFRVSGNTREPTIRSSSGLRLCAPASGAGRHRTDGEAISGVVMHELQAIGEGWRRVIFGQKSEGLSPAAPVVASSGRCRRPGLGLVEPPFLLPPPSPQTFQGPPRRLPGKCRQPVRAQAMGIL